MAHLLIPHDHHSDCSVFKKDNECHAGNKTNPDKTPVFPIHCHAFNDLTFEKTSSALIVYNDLPVFDLYIVNHFGSVIKDLDLFRTKTGDFHNPPTDTNFLRVSPLRGPPAHV